MKLNIDHTAVFTKNYNAYLDDKVRFIVNTGGSRSSKTYSIIQLLIYIALTKENKMISIVRKSMPAIKASVYRDVLTVINDLDIGHLIKQNKSDMTFSFGNGSIIQFFSVDDSQKLRGRKHDYVFLNEANELDVEEFTQINMRTTEKIFIDWNPSDPYSFILDIEKRDNAIGIHSTYKDNPFLNEAQIKEIENLIETDESYYQIYALGIIPTSKEFIFTSLNYREYNDNKGNWLYGLDFGYVDQTALVKVNLDDGQIEIKELLYESYLTSSELIKRLEELQIRKDIKLICDSARPDLIEELRQEGYNTQKANKKINEGIDKMKRNKLFLDVNSLNLQNEFKTYKWRKVRDRILDEPVDFNNHLIDASRYAIMALERGEVSYSFYSF